MADSGLTKVRRYINSPAFAFLGMRIVLFGFVFQIVDHLIPFQGAYFRTPAAWQFAPFAVVGLVTFWIKPGDLRPRQK